MWLTEHHFQYEGYEVLPNLIQFGQHLAMLTKELRLGQMFNVVPQWHPLRLAEDFALADIITGGRMEFGVGRGTVPREAWALGHRRRQWRQRDVGRARPDQPRDLRRVDGGHQARLVPGAVQLPRQAPRAAARRRARPRHDGQRPHADPEAAAARSTSTSRSRRRRPSSTCPKAGHKAVYWLQNADSQKQKWDRYAEIREACGTPVGPGEDRCLVLNLHVAKTHEAALVKGRPGQDEFNKFLSPYGRFSSYRNPDG